MTEGEDTAPRRGVRYSIILTIIACLVTVGTTTPSAADVEDMKIALNLAQLLRSARTVISKNQNLINDVQKGDKGLTGEAVLKMAIANYVKATGKDPRSHDPQSRDGRLLQSQMASIREVMEEHQVTINRRGLGFKGFVPAVFARLVNERFKSKVGKEAEVKVTTWPDRVRNRKARPDKWETEMIVGRLMSPDWPRGKVLSAASANGGRKAFRVLVPEYYGAGCLKCHGEPKGNLDVTGYPKEGGGLDDLGGVISITLYR